MGHIVGGVLGTAACIAVVIQSWVHSGPILASAVRAMAALALGVLVGRLLFGTRGQALMEEVAGRPEDPGASPR